LSAAIASASRLDPSRAALVVIDVQDAFRKAVPSFDEVARAASILTRGAEAVGIPVIVTEQYPKGLGRTASVIADALPAGVEPIEKLCFSAPDADGFDLAGRDQVLLCGIEAHVCVNQTALGLLEQGVDVHVAGDAVGSRYEQNREVGLARMERAGATLTTVETALFELVGRAGTEEFKSVQKLVLEYAPNPEPGVGGEQ
jgi:nicotinamidase-related amidase